MDTIEQIAIMCHETNKVWCLLNGDATQQSWEHAEQWQRDSAIAGVKFFMGQGFQANGSGLEGWYDAELRQYRAAIGTIHHTEWGNVTLLEIWGGDHMKDHGEMVRGVMEYAHGKRKTCPAVDFFVNPFYKNEQTGQMILDAQDEEQKEEAAHLTKIADYCEIRNRLKKVKVKNPLALALKEEDDKAAVKNSRYAYNDDDEEEDEDDQ